MVNLVEKILPLTLQVGTNNLSLKPHSDSGFTLIEILCVLVMIGLLSGVVIMNVPRGKSDVEQQSLHLTKQLNALSQESLISGEIRAFGLSEREFGFYSYDGVEFVLEASEDWADRTQLTFTRNQQSLKIPETINPLIIFEPTKINTPFLLRIQDVTAEFEIRSLGDGRVSLERVE